jgi:hypothetical protein
LRRAYAKHAEATAPSLADWKRDWRENPQRSAQPKLLRMEFRSPLAALEESIMSTGGWAVSDCWQTLFAAPHRFGNTLICQADSNIGGLTELSHARKI